MTWSLSHDDAREIIRRAVEKSKEVRWISAYAVVDEFGNLISVSRVDNAPAAAVPMACSKAYLAAVTGRNTLVHSEYVEACTIRYEAYQQLLKKPLFPGPGAAAIVRDGKVVGGFSSSVSSHGEGMKMRVEGGAVLSRADIVTAYALQMPYEEQHADVP